MRSISTDAPPHPGQEAAEAFLSDAEWDALPLSIRLTCNLSGILMLLSLVRDEIHTEEGTPLLWMEESLDQAFEATDRIMRRLTV
ncbi:MAG TPA: hypothetical protein VEK57_00965 [Thermoanaerobaculia bacterium]|nr:hypothetical protein [Thermoanaerobaculia bacterium]